MKAGQYFALITGIFFLLFGILGFIPGLVRVPPPSAATLEVFDYGYGYLLGLFPINIAHNLIHIIVGLLGLFSAIALGGSRLYGRGILLFYGLLTVMGLIPYTNTTFGLVPIFGHDVWLHAIFAALGFYYGFIASPGLLEIASQPPEKIEGYGGTP